MNILGVGGSLLEGEHSGCGWVPSRRVKVLGGSRPEGERSGRRVVPGDGGVPRENLLDFWSSIPPFMTFFVNYKQFFSFCPQF